MNYKNTKKLINDFPLLYSGSNKPPTENLMCFGFECDDGWFNLIYKLSQKLEEEIKNIKKSSDNSFPIAVQVKEKFGSLRFYITSGTDKMYSYINEAERLSIKTCEKCGKPSKIRDDRWYIKCLCGSCNEKI